MKTSFQKYEIISLLGKGSTGGVYHAHDHQMNRDVAMRRFFTSSGNTEIAELEAEFIQIAHKLSAIQHPNILPVYDAGVDEDGPFLINQLVNGKDLQKVLEETPFDEAMAKNVAQQLLDGLGEAHDNGLIHGSLHPTSILIAERRSKNVIAMIQDLGIHRITPIIHGPDSAVAKFFEPALAAPELFEVNTPTVKSDLYSMGHIIYMSLIGGHPFAGLDVNEAYRQHKTGNRPSLQQFRPDISQDFRAWLNWLMDPVPAKRPESAYHAIDNLPESAMTPPPPSTTGLAPDGRITSAVGVHANMLTSRINVSAPSMEQKYTGPIQNTSAIQVKSLNTPSNHVVSSMTGPQVVKSGKPNTDGQVLPSAQANSATQTVGLSVVYVLAAVVIILVMVLIIT